MARRDDDEELVSRLLGEEMQRTFWEFHDRDYLTASEIAYLRTTYCMDPHVQRELYDLQEKYSGDGMEPGADVKFLSTFWASLESQYSSLLRKLDPLSRASALAARPARWYKPWPIFSDDLWTSWVQPGNDGYVIGVKGSGKTDFMCLLAEMIMKKGGTVVSCIPLEHTMEGYVYTTTATSLLRRSCDMMSRGETCLVLLDEGFLYASGESPLKDDVMAFRQFARLFRKLGIASLMGSQRKSDILRDIRVSAALRVKKTSKQHKDRAHVQIKGEVAQKTPTMRKGKLRILEFSDFVKWVPPTSLPFRTYSIGSFVMDFDPVMLMGYLSRQPMEEEQFGLVVKWLDGAGVYFTMQQRAYISQRMREEGIYVKHIASVFDVSERTIFTWLKKKVRPIWGQEAQPSDNSDRPVPTE